MNSEDVKGLLFSLGVDLCGIAGVDQFDEAPQGYHPLDVLPTCKSVISFGCRFPAGTLACKTPVPYTRVRNSITDKMDAIALNCCIELEKLGALAIPIPTNGAQWDRDTGRTRSIVSQKHAAQAAGLGTIGRHSMLITPEFGSMVWLGCVLTEAELTPDRKKEAVCNNCGLCAMVCPVNALKGDKVDQQACWDYAFGDNEELQTWVISCHRCRDCCPYNLGSENRAFSRP